MKILITSISMGIILILSSCLKNSDFDEYVGTWEPIKNISIIDVSKIQIEKMKDFYLLIVEYDFPFKHQFYYVCKTSKSHMDAIPSKNVTGHYTSNAELKEAFEIYYDDSLENLFLLNYAYKRSSNKIIEIKDRKITLIDYK